MSYDDGWPSKDQYIEPNKKENEMRIEIDKAGLLVLVKSVCPNWALMNKYIEHRYGYYADQGGWFWNKSIEMLSKEKLHKLYRDCIISWE